MVTKAKSNSVVTHEPVVVDGVTMAIKFKVVNAGDVTLRLDALSDAVKQRAIIHGLVQRCSDGAAKARNPANGQPASPADKLAGITRLVEHYNSGTADWSPASAGGGGFDSGLVIEALVRSAVASDADVANEIARKLAEKRGIDRDAALREWAKTGKVAGAIADIKAERARKAASNADLDADELLASVMAEEEGGPGDDEPEDPPVSN